jgi:hypothetical protein
VATAFFAEQTTRIISDAIKRISRLRCPARKMWDTINVGRERVRASALSSAEWVKGDLSEIRLPASEQLSAAEIRL